MIHVLRYKLGMFGVPLDRACNVFCDNKAVYKSTMRAEFVLKKKNLSIAHHKTREAISTGVILITLKEVVLITATCSLKFSQRTRDEN